MDGTALAFLPASMDIPRIPPNRTKRRLLVGGGGVLVVALVTVGLSRLQPAAPRVDKSTLWIEPVTRGPFVRDVRGNGTLVPEEIRWIPAVTEATVERVVVLPGAVVGPDTVLIEMTNPELQTKTREAELALAAAEADLTALRVQLEHQLLDQEAQVAQVEADYQQTQLESERDTELLKDGLVSKLQAKISQVRAEEAATRKQLEARRLKSAEDSNRAQLAAQQARVEGLRETSKLQRAELDALQVRAGFAGVLQAIAVEPGQRVAPGANLARVANPDKLKAELHVPETQARDVAIGLKAAIDTRNGVANGHVVRVDPAVTNGTVTVDVALDGELPKGARPDLSVDGTITIEHLDDVLTVGRPAFGQPDSKVTLFKLTPDGDFAVRVPVELGRGSVHRIEVVGGLAEGDRVVLSDMSTWDAVDRVRLE